MKTKDEIKEEIIELYGATQALNEVIYGSFGTGFSATFLAKHNTQINNVLRRVVAKEDPGVSLTNVSHTRRKQ